jgi:hypothetical protein
MGMKSASAIKRVIGGTLLFTVAGLAYAGGMGMKKMEGGCAGMMESMMDANKDGKVSKEEFIKHHEEMFTTMDKNKDGALEKSEMGMMGDMQKMHGGQGGMKM